MIPNESRLTDPRAFLAMPPPRQVPATMVNAVAPVRGQVFFGGIFLLVGLMFCWLFLPRHLPSQWRLDHGPVLTVTGKITAAEDTKTSVNGRRVRQYRFSYQPDSSGLKQGTAYTTGPRWSEGQPVSVRYLAADPALAVPEGARLDEAPAWVLFVLLFPLVGAAGISAAIFTRRNQLRLLRDGRLATATVNSVEKTNVEINGRPQFKIHLTRSDDRTTFFKRSCNPVELAWADERMKAAAPIKILYDPNKPTRFLFPETWNA